jgi:hypothetical protein
MKTEISDKKKPKTELICDQQKLREELKRSREQHTTKIHDRPVPKNGAGV